MSREREDSGARAEDDAARPDDALGPYREKRDFGETPEPAAGDVEGVDPADAPRFVIHRHDARRLHYDLRLEVGGTLKCWAVPKGLPDDPDLRHLAVQTEDHPVEYMTFHGVIPKGQYGAGAMTIVDTGTYELEEPDDWSSAFVDGKIAVFLRGRRFRGSWHLVRTKRNASEDGSRKADADALDSDAGMKDQWLLLKFRDRYARDADAPFPDVDFARAERAQQLPRERITPMETGETVEPFTDADWVFEMRFEGRRVMAFVDRDDVRLVDEDSVDHAETFPAIVRDLGRLRAEACVFDGVLVALDEQGRPARATLDDLTSEGPVRSARVSLQAFDCLFYDEWDLRAMALKDRKALLQAIVPALPTVCGVDHVTAGGEAFAATLRRAGLTGAIAKSLASAYEAGQSKHWRAVDVEADPEAQSLAFDAALGQPSKRASRYGRVRYTNLDKTYWPATGETKGDLISYYEQVAPFILPHLAERPLHMNRYPDGIEGKNFYQRKTNEQFPDWIEVEAVRGDRDREAENHVLCNDAETLMYLANLGSIDLHPWMSRRGSLDSPDFCVIDLDPKEAPFLHVIRLARTLGTLLRAVEVPAYLKTSGASGLHIEIPLVRGYSYEQSRMFGEVLARFAVRSHKEIATLERSVGSRGGKVYVDYLQNAKGQTVVPAYVVRPVPGATVSTPLRWEELTNELHPSQFSIHDVPARLNDVGDLFRPVQEPGIDLLQAIAALAENLGTV